MWQKKDFLAWLKVFETQSESQRRWLAAEKALSLGHGGIKFISGLTGVSRTTITRGINELGEQSLSSSNIRKAGAGRKSVEAKYSRITQELENILSETTAGDPMSRLKWTGKSTCVIAGELKKKGINIHSTSVARLLHDLDYSLQANKKVIAGKGHPDRDAQFKNINNTVNRFIRFGFPVISVDTKKKELVGQFKNNGRVWRKQGEAIKVNDHDFPSLGAGVAIPYGAYDLQKNMGFVNVGMSADTSEFAVNSIWQWWRHFGRKHYFNSDHLLVCADGGGSNGSRSRSWKFHLQEFSNKSGLKVTVCHYPPGTSKWNKIEHRMFSFISINWKGRPLENYESVVKLIGSTTTKKGLKIKARLDKKVYQKGIKIDDDLFGEIKIRFHKKFPSWNYTIYPL